MRIPFRKRFYIVIVGQESGMETPVWFMDFRTLKKANAWVEQANSGKDPDVLTRYEVREHT